MAESLEKVNLTAGAKKCIEYARKLGLTMTSGYRSPEHDKRVGGTGSGDHTKGIALDFAGSTKNMDTFASWCKANQKALGLRIVLWRTAGHYDHVHIAWYKGKEDNSPSEGIVEKGNTGGLVAVIQKLIGGLTVDGIYGEKTKQAVKDFQKDGKLVQDGIVGKNTWNALTEGGGVFFYK
jgi:peptidoglycan hydrolase-like protein with peptidoglycan-binding domain